jgi:hypothetical protein
MLLTANDERMGSAYSKTTFFHIFTAARGVGAQPQVRLAKEAVASEMNGCREWLVICGAL